MLLEIKNYSKKQYTKFDLKEVIERIVSKIPKQYLEGLIEIDLVDETLKDSQLIFSSYFFDSEKGLGRIVVYPYYLFKGCNGRHLKNKVLIYLIIGQSLTYSLIQHQNFLLQCKNDKKEKMDEMKASCLGAEMIFNVLGKLFPRNFYYWILTFQLKTNQDKYKFIQGIIQYPIRWESYFTFTVFVGIFGPLSSLLNFVSFINFMIKGLFWNASFRLLESFLFLTLTFMVLKVKTQNLLCLKIVVSVLVISKIIQLVTKLMAMGN